MRKLIFLLSIVLTCPSILFSQAHRTTSTITPAAFSVSPPLREISPSGDLTNLDSRLDEAHGYNLQDSSEKESRDFPQKLPFLQQRDGTREAPPLLKNFEGLGPMDNTCTNPDTEGDVGPNHYMQMVKRSFAIWDKEGTLLYGPENNKTLWAALPGPWLENFFTDPIVIYDHLVDRWLASNMVYNTQTNEYWEVIAYSATPDPLGEWYLYAYAFDYMPDYPKFGVWNHEYLMTVNGADLTLPAPAYHVGSVIWAINKEDLMNGVAEPRIISFITDEGNHMLHENPSCFLPSDIDGPMAPDDSKAYFAYVKDDAWGYPTDHLSIWTMEINWDNPASSTFEETDHLDVMPFTTKTDTTQFIVQANPYYKLQSIGDRLMYRLQYRNFGDHEMMTVNHSVTLNAQNQTGVRWYELRKEETDWSIYQQSTYSPDEHFRWMGSISMDNRGNMAVGYSVSGTDMYPAIRTTGRFDSDTLNMMTFEETTEATSLGHQMQNGRWGDYSCMTVDPVDDQTFWYTQMYVPQTNLIGWSTKIIAFKIAKELSIYPDTLKFETQDDCLEGKVLTLKNNSWGQITLDALDTSGVIQGVPWQVENTPALPLSLQPDDSLNLIITVSLYNYLPVSSYAMDTMHIMANLTYGYDHIIAVNSGLFTATNEKSDLPSIKVYPNPAKDRLSFSFMNSREQEVTLEIFDLRGREVGSMNTGKMAPGPQKITWDTGNLSPGSYFYSLMTERECFTGKLIILQ